MKSAASSTVAHARTHGPTPASCRRATASAVHQRNLLIVSANTNTVAVSAMEEMMTSGREKLARSATLAWKQFTRGIERTSKEVGPMLAMAALVPPVGIHFPDLLGNKVFMAGFYSFLFAQIGKIFTERYKKGKWDLAHLVAAGGMPSSHSSLCAGVTTALAVMGGLGSPVFACATAFTLVVMYDAMGVRRHAGMHAQVLNRVVYEISDDVSLGSIADVQLKEVLGHTPRQVICGALLGICVGYCYPTFC